MHTTYNTYVNIPRFMMVLIASLIPYFVVKASDNLSDGGTLGLQMIGAIIQKNDKASVALLKHRDTGRVEAVRAGFTVNGSYKVTKVNKKFLIVEKGTDRHLIYEPKFAQEFKGKNLTSVVDGPPPITGPMVGKDSTYREEGFERTDGKIVVSENFHKAMIQDNLATILMQATALPATRNGQVIGFELSQIDPSSIFDKAGLIDKDIVKKINGIAVNSAPQAIKLLKSLKSEKNIILEYERNGQDAKIEINVAH